MKGIDTASITTGRAHELAARGVQALGFYLRSDRATPQMLEGLRSVGIRLWALYEKGNPTDASYFTESQARHDGQAATDFAKIMCIPFGLPLFVCVDCDASYSDVEGYLTLFHEICRQEGYLAGVYGSGAVCAAAIDAGVAHFGHLAQSTGWQGFEEFKAKAAIVQEASATVCGFDVDWNEIQDQAVLW